MNLSRSFSKRWLTLLLLCISTTLYAQQPDSTARRPLDTRSHTGYTGWKRIVPTHIKAQYAGGMGVMSVGAGWDYGKKCRWETDLLIGYLPKRYSDGAHATFTLKQNYIPWSIRCHERLSIEPLSASLYLNFITGENYWMKDPDRYGGPYYRFASRMRLHLGLGQRATYHLRNPQGALRSVTLYYELHTYDLDICAKATNKSLKMGDIFRFSCGVKFHLMRKQ